jgi:uncharacterized membrane protein YdcZ (DUF606 family)
VQNHRKNSVKVVAVVLIALGVIALAYQGFSYRKQQEILRIGDASVTATTRERVNVPPIVGVLLVGSGVVLLIIKRRAA